jgi:class 3 adenylate cyclase/streptogramin lyase
MQRRGGRGLGAVLFTDIVGSTVLAAEMGNTRWSELAARHHRIVRRQIGRFGGREVDTAGDGFFVVFERPADAIRCAVASTEAVRELGIEIRAGVSFGELETAGRKPAGLVVNTAARVMSVGGPGEVLVPASVREIVSGAGITFAEHGVHRLKGLEEEFRLFSVTNVDGADVAQPLESSEAAERRREIFPGRARRGALLVGVGAGVLALIVVGWLLLDGAPAEPEEEPGPLRFSVVKVDVETGRVGSAVFIGGPGHEVAGFGFIDQPIAVGEGGVWLLRPPNLIHIDPLHAEVRSDQIDVGVGNSQSVVTGFDAVWVLTGRGVYRVHPGTDEIEPFLILPVPAGISTFSLALGEDVWVGTSDGIIIRMDPATGARDQAETELSVDMMAATGDGVWVADIISGELTQVDPESLGPMGDPIHVEGSLDQILALGNDVWILDKRVGTVTRIDTVTRTEVDRTRVGDDPTTMTAGLGAVWVGDRDGSLYRVDALTRDVREFPLGAEVLAVGVDEASGEVWVYLGRPVGPPAA